MKHFSLCVIILCLMVTANAYAMDFIVGAKSGYFIWEPFFNEFEGGGMADVDQGSGILYGPVISIIITPEITFSLAGLFGKQSTHWYSPNTATTWEDQPGTVVDVSGNYTADFERIDIDNALSYRLSDSFKIFAGYKYQRNVMTMRYVERRSEITGSGEQGVSEAKIEVILPAHGPALGVGYSLPLGSYFFTSTNLSFVYMWGKFELKDSESRFYNASGGDLDYDNSTIETSKGGSYDSHQTGLNFEPSVGAMVADTGVVFNLSARIQYLKIKVVDEWEAAPDGWMTDLFYGVYVSVLYAF